MKKLKIEYISIDDLTPYENNANYVKGEWEMIDKLMRKYGYKKTHESRG